MTVEEKLDLIIDNIADMKKDISDLKSDVGTLKSDVVTLKSDVGTLKSDVEVLKRSAIITETDIAPTVRLLLENHADLAKNVGIAKDVNECVAKLEFEMKAVKINIGSLNERVA